MAISLVTGGAGFIGAHVTNELVKMGHKVVVLDDLSGGFRENVNPAAIFVQGSITDAALIEKLFNEHHFDYVYHLAAYAAEGLSHFIKRFNYTNNLIGSVILINESVKHKVKCFVFTSSIAVYGAAKPPMREDMIPVPEDPYGIAKLAVEQDLRTTHEMFGLNYVIFRPHNVYGEYQNLGDRYRNVVGIFMNQLMQGKPLTVFGDGSQTRSFCYVDDLVEGIYRLLLSNYEKPVNIGNPAEISLKEFAEEVLKLTNASVKITYKPLPADDPKQRKPDITRAQELLGWEPKVGRAEGLKITYEYFKSLPKEELVKQPKEFISRR